MAFFFRSEALTPEIQAKATEVRRLLGLSPDRSVFPLVSSPLKGSPGELTVDTRSLWQTLASMSVGVEIPPEHLERKLVPPIAETPQAESLLLRVHSGPARPKEAYATVPYEGQWFWVANDDWKSKRTFTSILFLFTLAESGSSPNAPTLTIPTR